MTTLKLETEYCGTHEFEIDRKVLCFECEGGGSRVHRYAGWLLLV